MFTDDSLVENRTLAFIWVAIIFVSNKTRIISEFSEIKLHKMFLTTCSLVRNFERSLNNLDDDILVLYGIVVVDSCSSKSWFRVARENNQFFSLQSAFLVYIFCLFQCLNEGCSDFSNVVMFQVVISQMCMLHICLAINIWT